MPPNADAVLNKVSTSEEVANAASFVEEGEDLIIKRKQTVSLGYV